MQTDRATETVTSDATAPSAPVDDGPKASDGLGATIARTPYRFGFFQAVRLLARLRPERRPLGADAPLSEEVCRFRSNPSLAFPASEIQEYRPPQSEDSAPQLVINFFGMVGLLGALPRGYTDAIQERRSRHRDRTLHDFLDLFSHRLLSHFYRAWEKYRGWIAYENAARLEEQRRQEGNGALRTFVLSERAQVDPVSQALLEIAGLGEPALRYRIRDRDRLIPRIAIPDETFRFFAGLLSQRHNSAAGLEAALSAQFRWPVRVHQLCGRWLVLEQPDLAKIGRPGRSELSESLVVGTRVWDAQGKFRVEIGPLDFAAFSDCLPDGSANRPLTELTRLYAGPEFDFDFALRLNPDDVPQCQPGKRGPTQPRLGWTTWVRTQPMTSPAVVVLRPREAD